MSTRFLQSTGRIFFSLMVLNCFISGCIEPGENKSVNNRVRDFDSDWRFIKDSIAGAEQLAFDDSTWRVIDLPHDWSIEDLPNQIPDSIVGPFSKAAISKQASGYTIGGTAWYRKHFKLSPSDKNRRVFIEFDGVMEKNDVWINGFHLGQRPSGYVSFAYELTEHLNFDGRDNVIVVRADTSAQPASWNSPTT